jgi:hypothetical protein
MNLKLTFGLLTASILLAEQAQAQMSGNQLRGIDQITLVFEQLDEDQKECQITEALIRESFMYPASGARFVVKETMPGVPHGFPFIHFNITTLSSRQNQACLSNRDMRLRAIQDVKLVASGRNIFGVIQLWFGGGVLQVSPKGRHGQAIREGIEEKTKKFITDWNLDNK